MKSMKFGGVLLAITGFAIGLLLMAQFITDNKSKANQKPNISEEFHNRVRSGIGTEIQFANEGSSSRDITTAVETLSAFITKRSGVELSADVRNKLVQLEQAALTDKSKRISFDQFVNTLTDVSLQRVAELTDDQLSAGIEGMRSIDSPELPEPVKKGRSNLHPRGSVSIDTSAEEILTQLKALRSNQAQTVARPTIEGFFAEQIEDRLRYLSAALPEQFGKNWNTKKSTAGKALTPLQAFVLAYSIASDDPLADSQAQLNERMQNLHKSVHQRFGSYPSPANYKAYGVEGYLHRSPLNITFDNTIQGMLLAGLER